MTLWLCLMKGQTNIFSSCKSLESMLSTFLILQLKTLSPGAAELSKSILLKITWQGTDKDRGFWGRLGVTCFDDLRNDLKYTHSCSAVLSPFIFWTVRAARHNVSHEYYFLSWSHVSEVNGGTALATSMNTGMSNLDQTLINKLKFSMQYLYTCRWAFQHKSLLN